jgi:hypothetical protein
MRHTLYRLFIILGTRLFGPKFPALWALPDIRFLFCSVSIAVPTVLSAIFYSPASRPGAAHAFEIAYVVVWTAAMLFDVPNSPGGALIPAALGYGLVFGLAWSAADSLPAGLAILFTSVALQIVARRRGRTIPQEDRALPQAQPEAPEQPESPAEVNHE